MLTTLAIKDLAIIDEAVLELGPGLNVLTGQTGAGKSIIIEALSLVLGDRARTDTIRHGADKAEVSAAFALPADDPVAAALRAQDLLDEDGAGGPVEVVIRRIIASGGRGRVYINGRPVTVQTLAGVTRGLVDVSSQHQHTQLMDPGEHLAILDRYGELAPLRDAFRDAYRRVQRAREAQRALRDEAQARVSREDFVRFQLDEITQVAPEPGEDEALEREQGRLAHADRLMTGSVEVAGALRSRSGSVDERLRDAGRILSGLVAYDPVLAPLSERLESARLELEDVGYELTRYRNDVNANPDRLRTVNDRLTALRRLERKHGSSLEAVLAARDALTEELARFESLEEALLKADAEVEAATARAWTAARALSDGRQRAATALRERVVPELRSLAMDGADLSFALAPGEELGPDGCDDGHIEIQTNPGEGYGPLHRLASGGELSRVLLALKRALTRADPVGTCIFDEIDSGTGGAVGDVIGMKLQEMSDERQVLVITHLAQIAARASTHLKVEKAIVAGRTVTTVRALEGVERHDEIARMLGGLEITVTTRDHAAELLQRAHPH